MGGAVVGGEESSAFWGVGASEGLKLVVMTGRAYMLAVLVVRGGGGVFVLAGLCRWCADGVEMALAELVRCMGEIDVRRRFVGYS